jgi:pantothenate kinase
VGRQPGLPASHRGDLIDSLADDVLRLAGDDRRAILGLAGPPGAGKSTLATALVEAAGRRLGIGTAAYLPLDGFHLSNAQLGRLSRRDRKGAPDTFDVWGYVALLRRVLAETGLNVYAPGFDHTSDEPVAASLLVPPEARIVVTEGNYLAVDLPGWREARALMREVWYVDAPEDVREARLVARQVAKGLGEDAARAWVERSDRANAELVERTKDACDRRVLTPLKAGG